MADISKVCTKATTHVQPLTRGQLIEQIQQMEKDCPRLVQIHLPHVPDTSFWWEYTVEMEHADLPNKVCFTLVCVIHVDGTNPLGYLLWKTSKPWSCSEHLLRPEFFGGRRTSADSPAPAAEGFIALVKNTEGDLEDQGTSLRGIFLQAALNIHAARQSLKSANQYQKLMPAHFFRELLANPE